MPAQPKPYLSARAENVLMTILSSMTEVDLLSTPGCGRKTLNEFKDTLAERGLRLKTDPPCKEFAEQDFVIEDLKVKYALRPIAFLVRYRDADFIVIEYKTGAIYKLPIKDLNELVRVELNRKTNALARVPLYRLIVGRVIRFGYFDRLPS